MPQRYAVPPLRKCEVAPGALQWVARAPGGLAPWQLQRAREYIETHYARELRLEEIAREVRLSPYHFARAFSLDVGMPPHRYLVSVRMLRARRLLTATRAPIAEVAAAVGYQDQGYFARLFQRMFGMTPSAYRRQTFV